MFMCPFLFLSTRAAAIRVTPKRCDSCVCVCVCARYARETDCTVLFKIITRVKLLFSKNLGDYSYSFQGSSKSALQLQFVFLAECSYRDNSPQEFSRFFCDYSYMIQWLLNFHWEIKGRFRKRVVLANVPSFRFSFQGNIRICSRSGFRSGEDIRQNHPFGKPPFCQPGALRRGIGVGVKGVAGSDAIVAQ